MSGPPGDRRDPRYAALAAQYGSRPPVNNGIIEYASAEQPRRFSSVPEFMLGLMAPLVYGGLMWATQQAVGYQSDLFIVLTWVQAIVFVGGAVYLRRKYNVRAFMAGVLTAALAAPLGVGIVCAVICGI